MIKPLAAISISGPCARADFAQLPIQRTRAERLQLLLKEIAHDRGSESTLNHIQRPHESNAAESSPDSGLAVTENDHDDVAAGSRCAADQAMTGGFGVTGLHPVAVRKAF